MIVVDASALVEIVLLTEVGIALADGIPADESLHAPSIIDVEILSALERLVRGGEIDPQVGDRALQTLSRFSLRRWDHRRLLDRAWGLRHNISAYDAMYVALAESLAAPLLTLDGRLAAAAERYSTASLATTG